MLNLFIDQLIQMLLRGCKIIVKYAETAGEVSLALGLFTIQLKSLFQTN